MRQYTPSCFRSAPRAFPLLASLLVAAVVLASADVPAWAKKPAGQGPAAAAPAENPALSAVTTGQGCSFHKILIVGDSFALGLGLTMEQSLKNSGSVALSSRGKISTGLNSPQFYDWEKALAEFLDAEKPDALLVMLGGNDAKNGRGTPQWSQDFEAKAKRFLDIAAQHKARVYWVGLPPMKEKAFSQRAWTANEAMRSACAAAPSCRFIESWDLFADKSGNFCAKKSIAGKVVALRGKDGVHFTMAGCKLLTDRIASGMTVAR